MAQNIIIRINVENAAFEDGGPSEVARILRELADRYDGEGFYIYARLRDVNGNTVGSVEIEN
jgi:hypothetical protein